MPEQITIAQFIRAIQRLPSDEPIADPRHWYRTQKEHWLGWLEEYAGPGAYGRKPDTTRDARFAYNHIVEPKMLLWLVDAAGVPHQSVAAALRDCANATSMQRRSAIIRRYVPWQVVATILCPNRDPAVR